MKNLDSNLAQNYYVTDTNTNEISKMSLRGVERRSNPKKDEIATPFGLAMTCKDNNCVCNGKT